MVAMVNLLYFWCRARSIAVSMAFFEPGAIGAAPARGLQRTEG